MCSYVHVNLHGTGYLQACRQLSSRPDEDLCVLSLVVLSALSALWTGCRPEKLQDPNTERQSCTFSGIMSEFIWKAHPVWWTRSRIWDRNPLAPLKDKMVSPPEVRKRRMYVDVH